ncbi:MAG: aminodeoxychorismate/anthranilate synthase component II [Actinobacteria bacterium]|nr:aminodeoxychorismate/anthranilate synthase component II [Actinomycetota bacterium]MCL6104294.1 aminodeoxychorismate/anthranilate synthase component II [Actinomycetota bacterium]
MHILVVDNYDSFVYNLVQYLGELGAHLSVVRNDYANLDELIKLKPDGVVVSPGPGRPEDAGISNELIKKFATQKTPILGVCLGHQCIGQVFGAKIVQAPEIMHGKTSLIYHNGRGVLSGLTSPITATRYHSLVIDKASLSSDLELTAYTGKDDKDTIMAVRHRELPIEGVQFHPESILTTDGKQLIANFVNICIQHTLG